ncbi:MAG: type II toxin-antitoxin system RelE/ParE family toxin [Pseudomonadota bacterium]
MARYRLSARADDDLDRLYVYGALNFGVDQADLYAEGMIDAIARIGEQPLLWPEIHGLPHHYRRSVFRAHAIYYRIEPNGDVLIVRVLGNEDLATAFDE